MPHIIVPVKQVPESGRATMDEETGTIKRKGVQSIVNPLDLYAVETALRLGEAHGGRVTALSMGPASAQKALREVISMGCEEAVLLSGRGLAGSDTYATAYALSRAIKRLDPWDLIVCGERATDGDTGQVGPALASLLGVPPLTYVSRVEDLFDGRLRVCRLVEDGYEVLSCPLPCVVTVVKEIADPRLPTLAGKRRARAAEIPTWGLEEIGAEPGKTGLDGSPTRVIEIDRPTVARQGRKILATRDHQIQSAVDELVEFLGEHHPERNRRHG